MRLVVEETPSPGCVRYITGTSIPLSVNENPEKKKGKKKRRGESEKVHRRSNAGERTKGGG